MKAPIPTTQLFGCSELELHYKRPLFDSMVHIKSSKDAETILRKYIDPNRINLKEFFWMMALTQANRLLGISEIASGSPQGVSMNIKEIFQTILLTNASAIIVAHNHPSGNLKPSQSDRAFTKKLQKLSSLMDVTLLDHVILSSEDYYSFSDDRLL
jgi:DNA repair protein RadC